VFPETLEERNSVSRLLHHAQYDGGGFRLGPPGEQQKSLVQLQPQLSLQLDRFSFPEKGGNFNNGGTFRSATVQDWAMESSIVLESNARFDSGFRDSGQMEQEPHLEKAINSVRFVAQHVKNQDIQ